MKLRLKREDRTSQSVVSAITLSDTHVITTGSALVPLLNSHKPDLSLKSLLRQSFHGLNTFEKINCDIMFESVGDRDRDVSRGLTGSQITTQPSNCSYGQTNKLVTGKIRCLWNNQEFLQTLKKTFPKHANWALADSIETDVQDTKGLSSPNSPGKNHKAKKPALDPSELEELLSYFILIELDRPVDCVQVPHIADPRRVAVGHSLYIQGNIMK